MVSDQILKGPPTTHPEQTDVARYGGPAGGRGSVRGIASIFGEEWSTPMAIETLARQIKPHGFMCVSCSWAKPADYHPFESCENGAKAALWELTTRSCTPEFFATRPRRSRSRFAFGCRTDTVRRATRSHAALTSRRGKLISCS